MVTSIMEIGEGKTGRVIEIQGGGGIQHQLRSIGIREGKEITVVTLHPFKGPIVISVDENMVSLGRGIASHILVEIQN